MQNYQIVQSPTGHLQLGVFKDNSDLSNNIFKKCMETGDEDNEHRIQISENLNNSSLLIQIRNKANLVRFFCITDFSFHFILLTFVMWVPLNITIIIISFIGFEATYTYNINSMIIYLLYQYIQTGFKLFLMICWFSSILSSDDKEILVINNMLSIEVNTNYIIFFLVVCLSQIFITYHVQSLYMLLFRYYNSNYNSNYNSIYQ